MPVPEELPEERMKVKFLALKRSLSILITKSTSSSRRSLYKDQDKNQGSSCFGAASATIYFQSAMMIISLCEEIVKLRLINFKIY